MQGQLPFYGIYLMSLFYTEMILIENLGKANALLSIEYLLEEIIILSLHNFTQPGLLNLFIRINRNSPDCLNWYLFLSGKCIHVFFDILLVYDLYYQ